MMHQKQKGKHLASLKLLKNKDGLGQNRTADTRVFSPEIFFVLVWTSSNESVFIGF
jgi:hypothetical protein